MRNHERSLAQPALADERLAPESRRVDLDSPTFSDPTCVTNPLFPVSKQKSVLLLGRVDGEPFRTEVTLLPETRIVEWQGRRVETLVSQYVAFLDGRIHEVAYDLYAQDDGGAVWYFGEDVFNFGDGVITDTHGTWLAGRDGLAAMIMPAEPKVGDVSAREHSWPRLRGGHGEEVGKTLAGPLGDVDGGLVVEEFHLLDNAKERKTFAPGTASSSPGATATWKRSRSRCRPTRSRSGCPQRSLRSPRAPATSSTPRERRIGARRGQPSARCQGVARRSRGEVPDRLRPRLAASLATLAESVSKRRANDARGSAIDVACWSLDLQLRHRPVAAIDLARFDRAARSWSMRLQATWPR